MSPENIPICTGLIAFLGLLFAPTVAGMWAHRNQLRKEERDYLRDRLAELRNIRAELQYYQLGEAYFRESGYQHVTAYLKDKASPEQREIFQKSQVLFGKAYAVMAASDIPDMQKLQKHIMQPPVTEEITILKLAIIDEAIDLLDKEYTRKFRGDENYSGRKEQ